MSISKEIIIHKVKSRDELDVLSSALTIEGIEKNKIKDWIKSISKNVPVIGYEVWLTKGSLMNEIYNLTGTNKYPDDLNIVSLPLCNLDLSDESKAMVFFHKHFQYGRWLDDIISNNVRREM